MGGTKRSIPSPSSHPKSTHTLSSQEPSLTIAAPTTPSRPRVLNHECVKSHRFLGPTHKGLDSVGLGWGPRICILTSSQMLLMLLIHEPQLRRTTLDSDGTFTTPGRTWLPFLLSDIVSQMPLPYPLHSPTIFRSSLIPKSQDQSWSQAEMAALTKVVSHHVQGIVVVQSLHHVRLFATPWTVACQLLCPWDFPGRNT